MFSLGLTRREILELLVIQGIRGLSRLKYECRMFESYWDIRIAGIAR